MHVHCFPFYQLLPITFIVPYACNIIIQLLCISIVFSIVYAQVLRLLQGVKSLNVLILIGNSPLQGC